MGQARSCTRRSSDGGIVRISCDKDSDQLYDDSTNSDPSILSSLSSDGNIDDGKSLEQAMDRIYQKLEANLNESEDNSSLVSRLAEFIDRQKLYQELVNMNFSMFHEIAKLLEANANKRLQRMRLNKFPGQKQIRELKNNRNSKNEESENRLNNKKVLRHGYDGGSTRRICSTINKQIEQLGENSQFVVPRDSLNLVLLELIDAADCYAKADCFRRSDGCEKKAKLVAMQLALLNDDIDLIDPELSTSTSKLHDLIVNCETFYSAHIVAEAYDYHFAWRQALFKHVLLEFDIGYLNDYCNNLDFSAILVEELILLYKQYLSNHRYQLDSLKTGKLAESLKCVIHKLSDIEMKCKFFTQLSFDDVKETLLQSDPSVEAHLKDLRLA